MADHKQHAQSSQSRCSSRQRGGVYLTVLGASMIITILGVTGLYAVRLQGKISAGANEAMRAVALVQSATAYARLQIKNDAGWRTRYTHNTWTNSLSFDGARLTFKLVDEIDANLANDATQPVRLHAKATLGNAVRIQSVQLSPSSAGLMLPVAGSWRQEVMP